MADPVEWPFSPPPPFPALFLDQTEALWFVTCGKKVDVSFRSCWIIDLRFFLSNSLERRQGSWRWKSLTDIKELQKCEILVSILMRQISVLPAGKKKNWEKLRQFSDVFARTSIASTHVTHLHQSANNTARASILCASERGKRAREKTESEGETLLLLPLSSSLLS